MSMRGCENTWCCKGVTTYNRAAGQGEPVCVLSMCLDVREGDRERDKGRKTDKETEKTTAREIEMQAARERESAARVRA